MAVNIDVIQLLTNLSVAAVSALISGLVGSKMGVKKGLEQAKKERAFDRRLEWSEKVVRTINRFLDSSWELKDGIVFDKSEEIPNLLKRLEETAGELDGSLDESVLFAQRGIVIRLRDDISYLEDLIIRIKDVAAGREEISDVSEVTEMARALAQNFRKLAFSLSQTIRKELDLDEISPDDLKTDEQKQMEKEREKDRRSSS